MMSTAKDYLGGTGRDGEWGLEQTFYELQGIFDF